MPTRAFDSLDLYITNWASSLEVKIETFQNHAGKGVTSQLEEDFAHQKHDCTWNREKKNFFDCVGKILKVLIPFQLPLVSILKACVLQSSYRRLVGEAAIQIPSVMHHG